MCCMALATDSTSIIADPIPWNYSSSWCQVKHSPGNPERFTVTDLTTVGASWKGVRPRWKRRIAKTPNPGRGLDV